MAKVETPGLTNSEILSFVGDPSSSLRQRSAIPIGPLEKSKFNWAAFFLGSIWFAYRKMYALAILFPVLTIVMGLIVDIVFRLVDGPEYFPLGFIVALSMGMVANDEYAKFVEKQVAKTKAEFGNLDEQELSNALKQRGGTSLIAATIAALVYIGCFCGWVLLMLQTGAN